MAKLKKTKDELFCLHYVTNNHNPVQSARAIGVKNEPRLKAMEMLRKPKIKARIRELERSTLVDLDIERQEIVHGFYELAKSAIKDGDKLRALENLGKIAGVYEEDNTQKAVALPIQMLPPKDKQS